MNNENGNATSNTLLTVLIGALVAGVIALLVMLYINRPLPSPEQIQAQQEAQLAKDRAEHEVWLERQAIIDAREAQKSDAVKSAEMVSGSVNGAIGAYVGLEVLKLMLR